MTKLREPITFNRALTSVADLIGWDRCAAICGVSERTVRNWSDPDTDSEIRLIDARRLDAAYLAAGGDHAPFHHTYALQLELGARAPIDAAEALSSAAGSAAKETGEAVAAMLTAASREICQAAARNAEREIKEAIDALGKGLDALRRRGD